MLKKKKEEKKKQVKIVRDCGVRVRRANAKFKYQDLVER